MTSTHIPDLSSEASKDVNLSIEQLRSFLDMYKSQTVIWKKLISHGFVLPAKPFFTRVFLQGMAQRQIKTLHLAELTRNTLAWTRRVKKSTARELLKQVKSKEESAKYIDPSAKL